MTTTVAHKVSVVQTGADRLLTDGIDLIKNKKLGALTNHTGRLSNGKHLIEALIESGLTEVAALFGPEHGISGNTPDGKVVDHGRDPRFNIPIFSLYGKTHKPTKEMLQHVDLLICDIQDVGARFYTFISTIALALEGAAENNIPVLLLDRPNPIRGLSFDGPVRDLSLKSFVGWMPIPVTHGMTIGELARMWNNERQLLNGVEANLEVLPMSGWKRSMWFDETGLQWIPPSPNMQRLNTAIIYPGLCFIEGTSVSEGRGTATPFELIGAPWLDAEKVIDTVHGYNPAGVSFVSEDFVPEEIPGAATEPKFQSTLCHGVRIRITNRNEVQPVRLGIEILSGIKKNHPKEMELRHRRFDILTGNSSVRKMLDAGSSPDEIFCTWTKGLKSFEDIRSRYLLYP